MKFHWCFGTFTFTLCLLLWLVLLWLLCLNGLLVAYCLHYIPIIVTILLDINLATIRYFPTKKAEWPEKKERRRRRERVRKWNRETFKGIIKDHFLETSETEYLQHFPWTLSQTAPLTQLSDPEQGAPISILAATMWPVNK